MHVSFLYVLLKKFIFYAQIRNRFKRLTIDAYFTRKKKIIEGESSSIPKVEIPCFPKFETSSSNFVLIQFEMISIV